MKSLLTAISMMIVAFVSGESDGLEFSREVKSTMDGLSGSVVINSGCSKHDKYGSNDCDLKWDHNYTVTFNGTLPEQISNGSTFHVDIKIDDLVKADFHCPLCGGKCEFEVAKHKTHFEMPPCPLAKAGLIHQIANITLPKHAPAKISFKGTVSAKDPSGKSFGEVEVEGKLH
eukprot:TRINITY_DN5236_c8_g1_i1.p1 TRINITY_DN5236_c8_g1~~TRINITY_DN5236_c8_g1_i1.p1  ORF type:complete len:196 (+),score=37.77 TRINITY_DN5236_c8_g1_i1:70-588(+)